MASFKDFLLTDLYDAVVSRWNALKKRTVYVAGADDTDLIDGMVMLRNNRLEQYSASGGTWAEYIPKATGKYDINVDRLDGFDADHFASVDALAAKEPAIAAGTSAQYLRGDKSWADLASGVRAVALSGLSTATSTAILATDTVLSALGKLQAQVTALVTGQGSLKSSYSYSNGEMLTAAQAGMVMFPNVATAVTVYLPSAANISNGSIYLFYNHQVSADTTVTANSGQSIMLGIGLTGNGSTVVVKPGTWVELIRYSSTSWLAIGPGSKELGVGQTWQDVASSRAINTTYYNTTGRTIVVSVATNSTANSWSAIYVNGVMAGYAAAVASQMAVSMPVPVPPGASYSVTSNGNFNAWAELR